MTISFTEKDLTLYLQRIEGFSVWTPLKELAQKYQHRFDAEKDIATLKKMGGMHLKYEYKINE